MKGYFMRYFALLTIMGLILSVFSGSAMARDNRPISSANKNMGSKSFERKNPSDFVQGVTTIAKGMKFKSETNQDMSVTVQPTKAKVRIGF